MKMSNLLKTVVAAAFTAAAVFIALPQSVRAAEDDGICHVLVYSDREGAGRVESYYNDKEFKYTVDVPQGSTILVKAYPAPYIDFIGWHDYKGILKTNKQVTFNATGKYLVIYAEFRPYGEGAFKVHDDEKSPAYSSKNWAGTTCQPLDKSDAATLAVTTKMVEQGPACMAVFEAMKGDYTIARTYNISYAKFGSSETVDLANPIKMVFKIPTELQKPGREFVMVDVHNGQPTIHTDLDTSDETITYEGRYSGAYALYYKDAAAAVPVNQ